MNEIESASSLESLFNQMRSSETSYLQDLSALIACCQYNVSLASSALQVDIAINNNLKSIALSLLSTHLALKQTILSLDYDDPSILHQFLDWLAEVAPLYEQYINYYTFDPDQPEREIYLKRRPLVRIRYITKILGKLNDQDIDQDLKQSIVEFYEKFSQNLSSARDKDDNERTKVLLNSILFDDVRCLESMTITASNFKVSDVLLRECFQMSLKHPQRIAKLDIEVEVFALVDPFHGSSMLLALRREETPLLQSVHSLGICSVEKLGRSLMFPPFRMNELRIHSIKDEFDFASRDKDIVLVPFYSDLEHPEIMIHLKIQNSNNFGLWLSIFNKLFPQNSSMDVQSTRFGEKHGEFNQLPRGKAGLDIRLSQPPVAAPAVLPASNNSSCASSLSTSSPPSSTISPAKATKTLLHRSKPLETSPSTMALELNGVSQVEAKSQRPPLANMTNLQTPSGAHTYRILMFQKLSTHATPTREAFAKEKSPQVVQQQPLSLRPSKLQQSQALQLQQHIDHYKNMSTENLQDYEQPSRAADNFQIKRTLSSEFIPQHTPAPESATIEIVAPSPLNTLEDLHTRSNSVMSAVSDVLIEDAEIQPFSARVAETPASLSVETTSTSELKVEKRQRRKSIFSVFGLKKKTASTPASTPAENDTHSKADQPVLLEPLRNVSATTLGTQETLTHSKSNKNINKLTIDTSAVNKLSHASQFEPLTLKKMQTAVTTPGSMPSPFARPDVDSPTAEISNELKSRFKTSRSLCNFKGRVSTWNVNKWEMVGGKDISIFVFVNEEGGFFVASDDVELNDPLIVLSLSASSSVRRTTALDIQLKTKEKGSTCKFSNTLIRCTSGAHAELLIKALEMAKKDMPKISGDTSMTSLNSSSGYASSVSSNSLVSQNQFNSSTSINNNNNLADDILSLGRPKIGNTKSVISPVSSNFNSLNELYFTPPSSAVDLTFHSLQPSPTEGQQLLLLLSSMKIRLHEKEGAKWQPKTICTLELYALEYLPSNYQLKVSGTKIDHLIKSDNVLRVGNAGILLSLPQEGDSGEYMLEFKRKKLADSFYETITKV